MVTHDPAAAAYTDRILFLADGRIVDELRDPDRDAVLERMGRLQPRRAAAGGLSGVPTDLAHACWRARRAWR